MSIDKIWESFFPWKPSREIYFGSQPKDLSANCHLKECGFLDRSDGSILTASDVDILVLIDSCVFENCYTSSTDSIISLSLIGNGCFYIFSSFVHQFDTEKYAHFAYIRTSELNSSIIKMIQTSISSCGIKTGIRGYIVHMLNGYQEYSEVNTSSSISLRCISFDHVTNCIARWLNVENNTADNVVLYINYKGIVKKSNLKKNKIVGHEDPRGVVATYDEGSYLVIDQCYFLRNEGDSLCYNSIGTVYFMQCSIDRFGVTANIAVYNQVDMPKNIFPTPYHTKYQKFSIMKKYLCTYQIFLGTLSAYSYQEMENN